MGKAQITASLGEGRYNIKLLYDRANADAEIARLTAENTAIDEEMPNQEQAQTDAQDYLLAKASELDQVMADEEATDAQKEAALSATARARQSLFSARQVVAMLKLRKAANQRRIEFIGQHVPDEETMEAWCADYNEELTGIVGTIETTRQRADQVPVIRPGGVNGNQAGHDAQRDGQHQPIIASTPAAAFLNYALLPGADTWKPLYRAGTISNISAEADTCTVTLMPAPSSHQQLPTGPDSPIHNVPIEYMDCDAEAFENGDEVVVEFAGTSLDPRVIGFTASPKECCPVMGEITGPGHVEVGSIYEVVGGRELTAEFNSGELTDISVEPPDGEEKTWRWEVTSLNDPCADPAIIKVTDICPEPETNETELEVWCDCAALPELFLEGPDLARVGAQYSTTGGANPCVFSMTGGTISPQGVVLSIDECGAPGTLREGTVTVADACEQEISMNVRLAGGVWVWRNNYSTEQCTTNLGGNLYVMQSAGSWRHYRIVSSENQCFDGHSEYPDCDGNVPIPPERVLFCESPGYTLTVNFGADGTVTPGTMYPAGLLHGYVNQNQAWETTSSPRACPFFSQSTSWGITSYLVRYNWLCFYRDREWVCP